MTKPTISSGVVHKTPTDVRSALTASSKTLHVWEDITPLARNEWLCWIVSAKKDETRERRIRIMKDKLLHGERRPCCWAGCVHR
jgi:uncharacterized protein YdeI (YjbR/CyaY-like superfamily)